MTHAADRFLSEVEIAWDSLDPWAATAQQGLSEVDDDTLRAYAAEADENYPAVEAEILAVIRGKVTATLNRDA